MDGPVSIGKFRPDPRNANRHTERGQRLVEDSLSKLGAGRSILVDKHGTVIAGNLTLETAAALGATTVRVIETNGTELVAVQRTDLDLSTDSRAKELAILDNRSAQVSLEWDDQVLADLLKEVDPSTPNIASELRMLAEDAGQIGEEEWPDLPTADKHVVSVRYTEADEPALKTFIRQMNDSPLEPQSAGRKILERIKDIVAHRAD